MKTVHARITGRVQGVGYRAWTIDTARKLKVTGWVRNRVDRSVEAVFQGSEAQIDQMLKACDDGPLLARVFEIKTAEMSDAETFADFTSKSTL